MFLQNAGWAPCSFFGQILYTPPPYSPMILRELLKYICDRPNMLLLIVSDFDACLNPALDRLRGDGCSPPPDDAPLAKFIGEVGWTDI